MNFNFGIDLNYVWWTYVSDIYCWQKSAKKFPTLVRASIMTPSGESNNTL